jgi:hypothetical protein
VGKLRRQQFSQREQLLKLEQHLRTLSKVAPLTPAEAIARARKTVLL